MSLTGDFRNLTPAASLVARNALSPQTAGLIAICILIVLAASVLGVLITNNESGFVLSAFGRVLCTPTAEISDNSYLALLTATAIWIAMTFVMMLPGATPMLITYAEIADTAAKKGVAAVSLLVLAAGYLTIWIVFALLAAISEISLAASLSHSTEIINALAGASLITASLYQFSKLKHACLSHCRSPFVFFFANWTDRAVGVFKLGLRQGLFCLGCCWALMLTMLAIGSMNLLWMTAIAVLMAAEKTTISKVLPTAIGVGLMLAGVFVMFTPYA
jgi:predicted metal-binding membrane protein